MLENSSLLCDYTLSCYHHRSLQLLAKFSAQRPSATRSYSFSRIRQLNKISAGHIESRSNWRCMLIKSGICYHLLGHLYWKKRLLGSHQFTDNKLNRIISEMKMMSRTAYTVDHKLCCFYSFRRSIHSCACFSFFFVLQMIHQCVKIKNVVLREIILHSFYRHRHGKIHSTCGRAFK